MKPSLNWNEDVPGKPCLVNRRRFVGGALTSLVASSVMPQAWAVARRLSPHPLRAINIMNFIRADEPREPMDLVLPVEEQMRLIKEHGFPATWLLQYDALVQGPFVDLLKAEMPPEHEVGLWFEMNRRLCDDAHVVWRGKPEWEWDYHVPIAYAIGYTPDERRRLADTAMATFKRVFGRAAKSIASWNLDAVTLSHLSDHYGVDAFGNCRDQLATDGFTIWGAPIAAYYPARQNAWSPAVASANQIATPMFRLLGQDPVSYYDNAFSYPDTMEPVWPSGQSEIFINRFLEMIALAPTQQVAFAQLGQENSFGWPAMQKAFPLQMEALAKLRREGGAQVETMGATGRRFKQRFASTPTQAQIMLEDPFGRTNPAERTVWYQSRFYRANLHLRGADFYLRDLHVYNDNFPQPYLADPVRIHGIDQKMLAVLDGYHWSEGKLGPGYTGARARGAFLLRKGDQESPVLLAGEPSVEEHDSELRLRLPASDGSVLLVTFREQDISFTLDHAPRFARLLLRFTWDPERSALRRVSPEKLSYAFRDFAYEVSLEGGSALQTSRGVDVTAGGIAPLRLHMAQHLL